MNPEVWDSIRAASFRSDSIEVGSKKLPDMSGWARQDFPKIQGYKYKTANTYAARLYFCNIRDYFYFERGVILIDKYDTNAVFPFLFLITLSWHTMNNTANLEHVNLALT